MSITPASERDLVWAAIIFEEKAKLHAAGKTVYVQVNSRQTKEMVPKLVRLFGGKGYGFGDRVIRWQIGGQELATFLTAIQPHLTEGGRSLSAQITELQTTLTGTRQQPLAVLTKTDAFNLLEGVDEDQLDLLGNQWEMFPRDADGRAVLRSHSREHTHEWMVTLNRLGYAVEVQSDTLIFVRRADELRGAEA